MSKLQITGIAGDQNGFVVRPAWEAVTAQLPTPVMVKVAPLREHCPLAVKLTGRPEVAVALRVIGASPYVLSARGPKVITCRTL